MYPHHQIWRPLALMSALVAATVFATSTITVSPGDTLSEIAERHDVTVSDLMDWNDIDDPDRIVAGETLIVSAPEGSSTPATSGTGAGTHVVTAGDTLSAIAARFGTSIARLIAANQLANPDRIYVGQRLALTTAAPTTTTPAPARTHTVVAGDTLGTIAAAYNVKTGVLAADNGIANPDLIVVGMVLTIGAPAPTTPAPVSAPAPTPPSTPTNARPADEVLLAPIFARWAGVYNVPQDLLEAIAWKESDWTPGAVGPSGHQGIMQLSPATIELIEGGLLGRDMDPLDADNGVQMGARFLRYLLDRTDSEREAVAAWRQGLGSVQANGINSTGGGYADAIEEIRRQRG
ncbi:MAG: LysM peptidoglycan-binding domain-containing protein [Acidimicrobiales bacterium]